jgi:hypothetical protein
MIVSNNSSEHKDIEIANEEREIENFYRDTERMKEFIRYESFFFYFLRTCFANCG